MCESQRDAALQSSARTAIRRSQQSAVTFYLQTFPDWLATMLNLFVFLPQTYIFSEQVDKFSAPLHRLSPLLHSHTAGSCASTQMYTHTDTSVHTLISKIRQMAPSHTLRLLMRLADTVNLCVRVMGVSSFWQTAARHTFLSNFESTLHLLWPLSETLWKLLELVNFYSLFTSWCPLAATGLYTHVLHINCTFLFSLYPLLSFLPPQLLLHLLLLSSSFFPPPLCSEIPFLCGRAFFPSSETGWLLYPLSNLHTEVTPRRPASERRRKGRWCGRRRKVTSLQLLKHLRPSLKHGLPSLPFVSSLFLKALSL